MQVEVGVERLDLRQDVAELMALESAERGDVEHGQPVVGDSRDVAGVVDNEYGNLRKTSSQQVLQIADMLGRCVVDEDDDPAAVGLERGHCLDGRHEVGGRLVGERHDGDMGHLCRLDDAALDEAAEVDDERLALVAVADGFERLPGLQGDDAPSGEGCLVDVGGAGVEVVGDQHGACVLGIADGVRRLTLPSFDRVEEYGHG